MLLQCYVVLWIHNIDTICSCVCFFKRPLKAGLSAAPAAAMGGQAWQRKSEKSRCRPSYPQSFLGLYVGAMCPVPRTSNETSTCSDHGQRQSLAESVMTAEACRLVNLERYFNAEVETTANQLSQVDVDWSMKLNRNLAANCRNISDEVFPGIHLGDRWTVTKNGLYKKGPFILQCSFYAEKQCLLLPLPILLTLLLPVV